MADQRAKAEVKEARLVRFFFVYLTRSFDVLSFKTAILAKHARHKEVCRSEHWFLMLIYLCPIIGFGPSMSTIQIMTCKSHFQTDTKVAKISTWICVPYLQIFHICQMIIDHLQYMTCICVMLSYYLIVVWFLLQGKLGERGPRGPAGQKGFRVNIIYIIAKLINMEQIFFVLF